jgi:tetratricopeptide (TPR) repeat protein
VARDAALDAELAAPVPALPASTSADEAMRAIDDAIAASGTDARALVPALLARAQITGSVDDDVRALATAREAANASPADVGLQRLLVQVDLRTGRFGDARHVLDALEHTGHAADTADLAVDLAQATGDIEGTLAERQRRMERTRDADTITLYALALADADRAAEAIALVPEAAAALHDTSPIHAARLLSQWGRIYEAAGQHASARDVDAEAHRRLPAFVEATEHLAAMLVATGDRDGAVTLVRGESYPSLVALDAQLSGDPARVAAAGAAWQHHVDALPLAFSEPAARFWLDVGRDPKRAFALALVNRVNRDTARSRALLIESALAAADPARACAEVGPLVKRGPRSARLMAWRALVACGRTSEAGRLARDLGVN